MPAFIHLVEKEIQIHFDNWRFYVTLCDFQAHLAPESETKFDFQKYISRSLEEDFTVVVGIRLVLANT